jgi:hypothetical protein
MGRKQKEKTYIKSIRVNTDIKEFLDIFVCAFGSLGIPPPKKGFFKCCGAARRNNI